MQLLHAYLVSFWESTGGSYIGVTEHLYIGIS